MPSPFIPSLLLYSILFLTVCCLPTDPDASANLDSSPQQQPPAVDYHYNDLPSTNFLATNNLNLDPTAPTISTDTTYAINNNDLGSSSQQELPEQQANGAAADGFGLRFTSPSSTGPLLLLSSNECDKSQNGDGRHPIDRAHLKMKKKRQLLNCPNPYLTTPNSPANSIKTLESGDEDNGRTQRGGVDQAPAMAIPGLIIQKKPEPNLSLCPDVERPIPVCGREDSKVPMGDSFLLPKCRPCKFFNFFLGGGDVYIYFLRFPISNTKVHPIFFPTYTPLGEGERGGGDFLGNQYRYSIRRL